MKVGDKVQIKSKKWFEKQSRDEKGGCYLRDTTIYFNKEMYRFCGKIYTIIKIEDWNNEYYHYLDIPKDENIDIEYWGWSKSMFKSLKKVRKQKLKKLKINEA